jgi:hypothetical protein
MDQGCFGTLTLPSIQCSTQERVLIVDLVECLRACISDSVIAYDLSVPAKEDPECRTKIQNLCNNIWNAPSMR